MKDHNKEIRSLTETVNQMMSGEDINEDTLQKQLTEAINNLYEDWTKGSGEDGEFIKGSIPDGIATILRWLFGGGTPVKPQDIDAPSSSGGDFDINNYDGWYGIPTDDELTGWNPNPNYNPD